MFSLTGGQFLYGDNTPIAGGVLVLSLSTPATIISTGGAAPSSYTFNLDSFGVIIGIASVYGNAELSPAGTVYSARVTVGGITVWGPFNWVVGPSAVYAGSLYPNVTVLPPFAYNASASSDIDFTGNNTHSGTETFTGPLTAPNIDGFVVVDGTTFPKTLAGIQAAIDSLSGSPGTVLVPPGTYSSTTTGLTMTASGQHLLGAGTGSTVLSYTGSSALTAIIDIGTAADGSANIWGISVNGFTIAGNSHVTYGIRSRGAHHVDYSNNSVYNVVTSGFYSSFMVCFKLDNFHVSVNEQSMTTHPVSGIILDQGVSNGFQTTAGTITNPVIEGVTGAGISLVSAAEISIISGTSEGNDVGISTSVNTNLIYITGIDLEDNATADFIWNGVAGAYLTSVISTGLVHAEAPLLTIAGGQFNAITLDAAAKFTKLENITYTTLTDNSTGGTTTKLNAYNDGNATYDADVIGAQGVLVGAATGGGKGPGTINVASGVYLNNTAYTNPDYVFEKAFTGEIKRFAKNPGAEAYESMTLEETELYTRQHFELPRVGGVREIFARGDILLEKVEEIYLHLFDVNRRLKDLERGKN